MKVTLLRLIHGKSILDNSLNINLDFEFSSCNCKDFFRIDEKPEVGHVTHGMTRDDITVLFCFVFINNSQLHKT